MIQISDTELIKILDIQGQITDFKRKIKELEEQEGILAALVMDKLRDGAVCTGGLQACLDIKKGRSSPSWKEEYVSHMIAEHGAIKKEIESGMALKYPAKESEVLVIVDTAGKDLDSASVTF